MRGPRWNRIWEIFHAALERPAAERSAFLTESCGDDEALRGEIDSLLASHERSDELPSATGMLSDEVQASLPSELKPGQSVGRYRIVRLLGEGGMGAVFEAEQREPVRRRVALKVIRLGMRTAEIVARFEAERQALAMMSHPNIARVFDAGSTAEGQPYFAMEYVEGDPINDWCDSKRLGTRERLELFLQVCRGVQHAHQKGVIHRDLKPSNVIVTLEDGRAVPKIIDFGIAKATSDRLTDRTLLTQAGAVIGTPEYMSPEQAGNSGFDVDTRTDVYSLGVILYELLIGVLPFDARELRAAAYDELRRRIREDEPARPSTRVTASGDRINSVARNRSTDPGSLVRQLRGDLDWVTLRSLEKDPERRYGSASDLAGDIERHLRNEPVLAGPPAASYKFGKFVRRNKVAVGVGGVLLLAVLIGAGGLGVGLMRARGAERAAREAERAALQQADERQQMYTFLVDLFKESNPGEDTADSLTARDVLERGASRIREEMTDRPALQAGLMASLSNVFVQRGELDRAEDLLQQAIEIRRKLVTSEDDVDLLMMETNRGGLLIRRGRYAEAAEVLERGLQLLRAGDSREDEHLATTTGNLALAYAELGRYDESLQLREQALRIVEKLPDADPTGIGREYRAIGAVYLERDDLEAARPHFERALELLESANGPEHPEVAYTVNSMAILYWKLKDYQEARPMFERNAQAMERTHGPEHAYTASAINNLGRLLLDMGELGDARDNLQRGLELREASLGPDHPEVAASLLNLGMLARAEGDPATAARHLERCLEIRESRLGPGHQFVAGALEQLAGALRELGGEDERASALEERARGIREAMEG